MSWEHFGAWKGNSWLSCVSLFGCVKMFHYLVVIRFTLSSELFYSKGNFGQELWIFHKCSSRENYQSAGIKLQCALTQNSNVKVINTTARLLCPKKALNRKNLIKSNYSSSGRRGKPLELRIKFLGREGEGRLPKCLLASRCVAQGRLLLWLEKSWGAVPAAFTGPSDRAAFLQRRFLTMGPGIRGLTSTFVFPEQS